MNTLTQIFDWLLAASARASLLTVVVLIAQAVLRHRVPARWLYALWLPVLLVLLVPIFPESPWSVASIIQTAPEPLTVDSIIEQRATLPVMTSSVPTMTLPKPINWQQVILIAWLIGAASVLAVGAGSFASSLWQIKRTRLPVSDAWLNELTRLAREIGLRRAPQVLMASAIRGPAVTGFLHPTLLLPAHFDETLTPQEARLVLKHELTHIKRGDLPLNALLCVLLALHWFNPLLWLAFFKARLDREAACDAQVLADETQTQRVAYGHILLKVETAFSHHGLSLGFVGIIQRGTALRTRIRSIANQPKLNRLMKTILTLSVILLTFFGITSAEQPTAAQGSAFTIGQTEFRQGDSIRISQVQRGADFMTVTADYELASADAARISLFITSKDKGETKIEASQTQTISKGKGSVVLHHPKMYKGMPHVSFYGPNDGKAFGGIYFGTPEEAEASKKMRLGYIQASKNEKASFSVLESKLDAIMLPSVVFHEATLTEAVEFLRVKSRDLDTATKDPNLKGVNIIIKVVGLSAAAPKITLDLKNVSLGEVVKQVAELSGLKAVVQPYAVALLPPAELEAAQKTEAKATAAKFIFPSVVFVDATLAEVAEFVRAKSRALDPAKQGLNIVLKPGCDPDAKVTFSLKNVPASEVLRYSAELTVHKLTQDGDIFIIAP